MKYQTLTATLAAIALSVASGLAAVAQTPTSTPSNNSSEQQTGVSQVDRNFARQAALANLAEIQMSQLALQKSANPAVRQYARQMVQQHSQATAQLQQVASLKGVTLPRRVDAQHRALATRLAGLSGYQFDQAYMQAMVQDHAKAVALFQRASQQLQDPDMKGLALQLLPAIQNHLVAARDLSNNVARTTGQ